MTNPHEDMIEVWLWSNKTAVFSHETALMLHNISDALPAKMHVTLPLTYQNRELPPVVIAYYDDIKSSEWQWISGIPVTKPLRTLDDCVKAFVSVDLVCQAVKQLIKTGPSPAIDRALCYCRPFLEVD